MARRGEIAAFQRSDLLQCSGKAFGLSAWDVWEGDMGRMGRNTSGTARGQGIGSRLREAASPGRPISGLVVVRSAAG